MRWLYIFLSLLLTTELQATHIVGGDFRLTMLDTNYNYQVELVLYFDNINGNPAAEDASANVAIYRSSDDVLMTTFNVPRVANTELISYLNPFCQASTLETRIIRYQTQRNLSPLIYNDPAGYYLVWERCCRNGIINNINNPGGAGMVFYLQFPAVTDTAGRFENNSPVFVDPFGDFTCIGQSYTFPYHAVDADGDSVAYSLYTPFNGTSSIFNIIPNPPQPKTWDTVDWLPGFSRDQQVWGTPELRIDGVTGELTVTPSTVGLHVFGVLAEEFRNGVKIGELTRDYQMLVLPPCDPNKVPTINVMNPGTGTFYVEGDTMFISPDADRCFTVFATDSADNVSVFSNNLVVPQGFLQFNDTIGLVADGDTLVTDFCWEKCADSESGIFQIELIASDSGTGGCVPISADTLLVTFVVAPVPNRGPTIDVWNPNTNDFYVPGETIVIDPNADRCFTIYVTDSLDYVNIFSDPLEIPAGTLVFTDTTSFVNDGDTITTQFCWDKCADSETGLFEINLGAQDSASFGCFNVQSTILPVRFIVTPVFYNKEIDPVNVFTPNGDGYNDAFELPTIPDTVCEGDFQRVMVFNRWGQQLFEDDDIDFSWEPVNVSAGLYYYLIEYDNRQYKGWLQILR